MRIATRVLAAAVVALLVLAWPAMAQARTVPPGTPSLPDLTDLLPKPKAGDIARFQATVYGVQIPRLAFVFNPKPGLPCSLYASGSLEEEWTFARGKDLVLEFRKLAGRVVLRRGGRSPGDTAFAAQGFVERRALGSAKIIKFPQCLEFPFDRAECREFPVRSDLVFGWGGGGLTLTDSGRTKQRRNPAQECGRVQEALNIDTFQYRFPFLIKQRGALTASRIFGSAPNLQVTLKGSFPGDPDNPTGYTRYRESVYNKTTVTLRRLGRR